jgi:hypothetical protein
MRPDQPFSIAMAGWPLIRSRRDRNSNRKKVAMSRFSVYIAYRFNPVRSNNGEGHVKGNAQATLCSEECRAQHETFSIARSPLLPRPDRPLGLHFCGAQRSALCSSSHVPMWQTFCWRERGLNDQGAHRHRAGLQARWAVKHVAAQQHSGNETR